MKIEQSGFRIHKFVLNRIPPLVFKIIILILTLILILDFSLCFFAKPKLDIQQCLYQYYKETHIIGAAQRAEQLMNLQGITKGAKIIFANKYREEVKNQQSTKKQHTFSSSTDSLQSNTTIKKKEILDKLVKKQDIQQTFAFVNSTTVLKIFTSSQLSSRDTCLIQLNYLQTQDFPDKEQLKPRPIQKQQVIADEHVGTILSSRFALYFNVSDKDVRQKHELHYHKIIIPQIQSGFRYLWMNIYRNKIDDLVWGVWYSLAEVQKRLTEGWQNEQKQVKAKIQEKQKQEEQISKKQKEQIKKNQQKPIEQQTDEQKKQRQQTARRRNSINYQLIKNNKTQNILRILNKNTHSVFTTGHQFRYLPDPYSKPQSRTIQSNLISKQQITIFWSIISFLLIGSIIIITSIFIGLLVKYTFIAFIGILQIVGIIINLGQVQRGTSKYISQYVKMMLKGSQDRIKMSIQIAISILLIPLLYIAISYIFVYSICHAALNVFLLTKPATNSFMITFCTIQIVHYIFFRSRLSLKFFPIYSLAINIATVMAIIKHPFYFSTFIIHCNLLIQLILIWIFLYLEKLVIEDGFANEYKPSKSKPRMCFLMGYDLDWEHSMPPLWTAFSFYYDLSFMNTKERARIDENYQLLYGCLMGLGREQEIPEGQNSDQQIQMQEESQRQVFQDIRPS